MNSSNRGSNSTSIRWIGDILHTTRSAIEHAFSQVGVSHGHTVVADGSTELDEHVAEEALATGHTVAILNARAGQLGKVLPGTGITVPQDVALFAVKRLEIPGHKHRYHTIVTTVPHPGSLKIKRRTGSKDGSVSGLSLAAPAFSIEPVVEGLARHVALTPSYDSSLIPPNGAYFGIQTFNDSWSCPWTQDWGWDTASGNQQTCSFSTYQTYYVYYANGAGQNPPLYVILMTQNSSASPAQNGASGVISNSANERALVMSATWISNTIVQGSLGLATQSPSATVSTPVTSDVSYPMTVMALSGGGKSSTSFKAESTDQMGNPDWGVLQQGNLGAGAGWMYYNITGWNASTQTFDNFADWWSQMYKNYSNSGSVIGLDSQCLNGGSFNTKAIWTISQNANNQQPLYCQFQQNSELDLVGFANPDGTGNGHHQMSAGSVWSSLNLPTWDLVAVTGSPQS